MKNVITKKKFANAAHPTTCVSKNDSIGVAEPLRTFTSIGCVFSSAAIAFRSPTPDRWTDTHDVAVIATTNNGATQRTRGSYGTKTPTATA